MVVFGLCMVVGFVVIAPRPASTPQRAPRASASTWVRMSAAAPDSRDEAADFMASRDWPRVEAAIAAAVKGDAALPGDEDASIHPCGTHDKHDGRDPSARITWVMNIAYLGSAFSGFAWQASAPLPTVQGCLQDAIQPLLDGKSALRLSVAGRTDAGVSALGQLVSFHSGPDVTEADLARAIAHASPEPGALRLLSARRMDRGYHATFSTTWRRYAYLLPPPEGWTRTQVAAEASCIDQLLRPLVGTPRDYAALGRLVPEGKKTEMLLRHASARLVALSPAPSGGDAAAYATRVEIVGDRFLRRQVRVRAAADN